MKVLFLTRDLPYPATNGYKKRNFFLIKELAARNIEIILLCEDKNNHFLQSPHPLNSLCKDIKIINTNGKEKNNFKNALFSLFSSLPFSIKSRILKDARNKIKNYLQKNPVDIIICDSVYRAANIPFDVKARKVLYEHNIESIIIKRYVNTEKNIFKKLFAFIEYLKFERFQRKMWNSFDSCIVCSAVDKKIIEEKSKNTNIFVINNGVDSRYFQPDSYPVNQNTLVYTGQIGWHPNEDAIIYFIRHIWSLIKKEKPEATFWVVGANPTSRVRALAKEDQSILVTGFVDDAREYIGKSQVYVVPLRIGSGTRLKILEALSMKKAVVSTSVGCEGLEVEDNKHLLIRDNPGEFAQAVLELMNNDSLRMNLGDNGRRLVEEKYDWSVVFRNLDEILK